MVQFVVACKMLKTINLYNSTGKMHSDFTKTKKRYNNTEHKDILGS